LKVLILVYIFLQFCHLQQISAQKMTFSQEMELRSRIRSALFIPAQLPALDVKVHGKFSPVPGVKAERITYNTLLGLKVTAILYLPDPLPAGKIPALIVVNGHGGDKYSYYAFYSGMLFAKGGAAVLTYDPIGEGERNINRLSGTRAHDVKLDPPEMGCRMGGLMVAEVMQAVSFLSQRTEVDANRIAAMGYSMGSFVLSVAGAVETRLHAAVLVGGGNLDGPGGYWDRSKPMCQGIPYQSLSFLGDRPAVIYSLHASRGPLLIFNGLQDSVVAVPQVGTKGFFDDLFKRTSELRGSSDGVFEYDFTEGGHRPYFLTKPVVIWLERQLDFPGWTEELIKRMPVSHISEWAKKNGIKIETMYSGEMREGGNMALGTGFPALSREALSVFTQEQWEKEKNKLIYESWVNASTAEVIKSKESRRLELIAHGGLKAACSYTDFLTFPQYKANLHCHSYHSDGSQYCDETAEWYLNHGYQVLSITDHDAYGDQDGGIVKSGNFQSDKEVHDWDGDGIIHKTWEYRSGVEAYVRDYSKSSPAWVPRNWQLEKPGRFIILNGIEYSFGDHPHINAINHTAGPIARPRESYNFINYTHSGTGLVFINHPSSWNKNPGRFYNDPDLSRLDGLEVMNGFEARDNRDGKNPDGSRGNAEGLWDGCLNAGLRLWGFANDDSHNIDTLFTNPEWFANAGSAWNMIWSRGLTRTAVMEALSDGAFYGSCGIIVDRLEITTESITVHSPNATHIEVVGDGGRTLLHVDASQTKYVLRGDEKWIRIVLWNDTACYAGHGPQYVQKAWLQPIMLDRLLTQ
jgi:dienelactone hydrolase